MARKPKPPLTLTDLERQVVLGIQARLRVLELEHAALAGDRRAFEAALAERLGLPAGALAGDRYIVNTQTWTLEPNPTPQNDACSQPEVSDDIR